MALDLRQLRYFRAVATEGSVTGAARALGVAQPAVSVALRRLETALDARLVNRGERGTSLTAEGAVLLRHAVDILDRADAAEVALAEMRGLVRGEVAVGVPSMMGSYFFPPILMGFKFRHPGVKLVVYEAGGTEMERMLHDRDLGLGVVVGRAATGLVTRPFLREEMVVCVPADHPFAHRRAVEYEAFLGEELVLLQSGYFHRAFIDRISAECGVTPRIGFESNLITLNLAIVRQGFGITTLLRLVLDTVPDEGLVAVPFEPPVHLDLSLAWREGAYLSHAERAFVDYVVEHPARSARSGDTS